MGQGTSGRLRVACFGAGWATRNRHVPALRAHGGFEVVAIADPVPGRAEEAARALGVPRHLEAGSADELPPDVDAVTCATPPLAHHAVVRSALLAGRHVLCDKPLTATVAEAEDLAGLAAERGLVLAAMLNFQFARSALAVRRWIDRGRLGRVRSVWAVQLSNPRRRLPEWIHDLPLGLFLDESPNLFLLAAAFAGGELETVSATGHPSTTGSRTPAQVGAELRHGEVPVAIQMGFEAPLSEWHVTVMGDRGLAGVDVFRDVAVFAPNDRGHRAHNVLGTSLAATATHWGGYLRSGLGHVRGTLRYGADEVVRRFHAAIARGERPVGIDVSDALAVARPQEAVARAVEASLAAGR